MRNTDSMIKRIATDSPTTFILSEVEGTEIQSSPLERGVRGVLLIDKT